MIQYPRFLIDDTTGISDGRIFVAHLQEPRFVGELMPDDEADILDGISLAAPFGQTVCRIHWFDDPVFDSEELLRSLAKAIEHHDAVRGG